VAEQAGLETHACEHIAKHIDAANLKNSAHGDRPYMQEFRTKIQVK
jgi:hypothetical protein